VRDGQFVALSQVARIELGSEASILWRRNRMPTVTVRADVVDGAQGPDVTARAWPAIEELQQTLPLGYRIEVGGAAESTQELAGLDCRGGADGARADPGAADDAVAGHEEDARWCC
jgi:multidrug efflux pump subunit AcrB